MNMDRDTDREVLAASGDWPLAMERGRVTDAAFATAYARVSDQRRALLKTGLAAMYAACGGPLPPYRRQTSGLGHDLGLTRLDEPLDFALVVCDGSFTSPTRLAAAIVPALCARVPEVAAVRVGDRWPMPLLVALELCGVETACRVGPRSLAGLWAALPAKGRGAVVLLGHIPPPLGSLGRIRLLTAETTGRVGVFSGPDTAFDREALTFAHPDMAFFVHGQAATPCQEPFQAARGALSEATDLGYDAVYVGQDELSQGLAAAPLALGPGRETFWFWPELSPEAFRRRKVAAVVDERAAAI